MNIGPEFEVIEDAKAPKGRRIVRKGGAPAKSDDGQSGGEITAAEALALADGNFMSFKAAAKKVLGDETPSKKDEIILALTSKAG